jgi:hypothetical protein
MLWVSALVSQIIGAKETAHPPIPLGVSYANGTLWVSLTPSKSSIASITREFWALVVSILDGQLLNFSGIGIYRSKEYINHDLRSITPYFGTLFAHRHRVSLNTLRHIQSLFQSLIPVLRNNLVFRTTIIGPQHWVPCFPL